MTASSSSAAYEWLNLLEISGPFLAVPVLREVFPQGLEELETQRAKRLRSAYEEWRDAVDGDDADRDKLHAAWIDEVLRTALEADDQLLKAGKDVPASVAELPEHDTIIAPELVFVDPTHGGAVLAPVHVFPPDTDLSASMKFGGLSCSPGDRLAMHVRALNVPFGIVTNGERWMLVHAPTGQVATFASWYARIWGQEPATLRAFTSLLDVRRFFAPAQDRLPSLFERSLKHQDEVTDALGDQVRRAIEVLVQALDRADQDRNRELLRDVKVQDLYEAGLTVMMRLVFLLAAEERGLLLLGEPRYDSFYAVSTLRMQLRAESDEILERRRAAWSRLLAVFRAVFGGIDHPTLRLPAMGGSLFDPDRFPFLEGRLKGTLWRQHRAEPLPIDDRTVLLLLEAIQTFEGRTLSYRALDVEQIGHVYEGLLERTVSRVEDVTLELEAGAQAKDARVTLGELESARLDGKAAVSNLLVERSKRSKSAIDNALAAEVEPQQSARLLSACRGDVKLRDRLEPYVRLLRTDPWGYPLVHPKGAFVVVLGADRRETGTHYTPKSLTERIVAETLTPIVYDGPSEGVPRAEWKLKTPEQLLDLKVCDPAMGSGAFLVQACRFLSARLVEAWALGEAAGRVVDLTGQAHEPRTSVESMPPGFEVRAENARRIVAERCLYGVDLNPLAVELAKLSLWLVTLSKGRPFGFLDHNLRRGDSLLGISYLEQLTELSLNPKAARQGRLFGKTIEKAVAEAVELRRRLREIPIRDIRDVEAMATLDADARHELQVAELVADAFIGGLFVNEGEDLESRLATLAAEADRIVQGEERATETLVRRAAKDLAQESPGQQSRRAFHWPLEFPEVFSGRLGFDAMVGNPPFLGGRRQKAVLGELYQRYVARIVGDNNSLNADLCAFFFRRVGSLTRRGGTFGLVATNSIAQGATRTIGLEALTKDGGSIYRATSNFDWPGQAGVTVAVVCMYLGAWNGESMLDGEVVSRISTYLSATDTGDWTPRELVANVGLAFQGSNVLGTGFVLRSDEARALIERNRANASVIQPFVRGEDFNATPDQRPQRWIINFYGWPLTRIDAADLGVPVAEDFPDCLAIVERLVRPKRATAKRRAYRERWWQYAERCAGLYAAVAGLSRVVFQASPSKHLCFEFADGGCVYSGPHTVIASDSVIDLAVLQSSIHTEWAWQFCSTMRNAGIRYNPSDFRRFPRPSLGSDFREVAEQFHHTRQLVMREKGYGLTAFYNDFHEPSVQESGVIAVRDLQQQIDRTIAAAYGLRDLDIVLEHRPTKDGMRFTLSRIITERLIAHLVTLNRQLYEAEQAAVLPSNPRSGRSRAPTASAEQGVLALGEAPEASPKTSKTKAADPAKKAGARRPR
jgi:hypothetical protein